MKVAFFVPSIERGGMERTMTRVLNAFADADYDVDLVYRAAEPVILNGISGKARRVQLPKMAMPVPISPRIRISAEALPGLVKYLRRERPQVLFSFQSSAIAVWAKKLSGSKTKLIVREASVPTEAAVRDRRLTGRLTLPFKRMTYPQADIIVAASKGAAQDLAQVLGLPESKIRVLYNPTFEDSLFERAQESFDESLLPDSNVPFVLGVGRLSPEKNFSLLVRAFARAREKHPCKLMILGTGEEQEKISKLVQTLGISDDVAMPGYVKNPYPYMAHASLLVLPSYYEGSPNVVIESLALGTPVVATRCPGGAADILVDGEAGPLVPVDDADAMAQAMLELLTNPELVSKYLQVARRGLQRYRLETATQEYIRLAESLCEQDTRNQDEAVAHLQSVR